MKNENEMEDLFKFEKEEKRKHPMRGPDMSLSGSAPWDASEPQERRLPDTTDPLALTQRAKVIIYCGAYATHKKKTVPFEKWVEVCEEVRTSTWWRKRNASAALPMKR